MALLVGLLATSPGGAMTAWACDPPRTIRKATATEIHTFFKAEGKTVVTYLGYSAAEYEDRQAMIDRAQTLLDQLNPRSTLVNIGATTDGIGAVYELAKARGFTTTGIVSTQARITKTPLSPCVDHVFYVPDATWGGLLDGRDQLSPTSAAMVAVSDRIIAIGGGDVARDELIAAKRAGKDVRFIPADMNHAIARERARRRGEPEPADFRGAAATAIREPPDRSVSLSGALKPGHSQMSP